LKAQHNSLGSKQDDRTLYCGWEITTYTRKFRQEPIIKRLKQNFNSDGWTFHTEYDHFYLQNDVGERVHITFTDKTYDKITYKITLKSTFFGLKNEKYHQSLFKKVYSHIPWKKKGYWLKDGNRHIPISIEE
jgi:hypothetical protein